MADVYLFNTSDGGDVELANGDLTQTVGYETALYLSLFGGNPLDNGSDATAANQWWANVVVPDDRKMVSRTQYLLGTVPATSGNLSKIEKAVVSDLDWLSQAEGVTITATASIPRVNWIKIVITIDDIPYTFIKEWAANDSTRYTDA